MDTEQTIQKLFPELGRSQAAEAAENLESYLKVVLRIARSEKEHAEGRLERSQNQLV